MTAIETAIPTAVTQDDGLSPLTAARIAQNYRNGSTKARKEQLQKLQDEFELPAESNPFTFWMELNSLVHGNSALEKLSARKMAETYSAGLSDSAAAGQNPFADAQAALQTADEQNIRSRSRVKAAKMGLQMLVAFPHKAAQHYATFTDASKVFFHTLLDHSGKAPRQRRNTQILTADTGAYLETAYSQVVYYKKTDTAVLTGEIDQALQGQPVSTDRLFHKVYALDTVRSRQPHLAYSEEHVRRILAQDPDTARDSLKEFQNELNSGFDIYKSANQESILAQYGQNVFSILEKTPDLPPAAATHLLGSTFDMTKQALQRDPPLPQDAILSIHALNSAKEVAERLSSDNQTSPGEKISLAVLQHNAGVYRNNILETCASKYTQNVVDQITQQGAQKEITVFPHPTPPRELNFAQRVFKMVGWAFNL